MRDHLLIPILASGALILGTPTARGLEFQPLPMTPTQLRSISLCGCEVDVTGLDPSGGVATCEASPFTGISVNCEARFSFSEGTLDIEATGSVNNQTDSSYWASASLGLGVEVQTPPSPSAYVPIGAELAPRSAGNFTVRGTVDRAPDIYSGPLTIAHPANGFIAHSPDFGNLPKELAIALSGSRLEIELVGAARSHPEIPPGQSGTFAMSFTARLITLEAAVLGDVNADAVLDLADVAIARRYLAGELVNLP